MQWGHFGLLFALANILHFHTSSFKTLFVAGNLRFDVDFLDIQIQLWCSYFGILLLGHCFGYFLKNWAIFSNLLVTLKKTQTLRIE
jgi:hypothetical protein